MSEACAKNNGMRILAAADFHGKTGRYDAFLDGAAYVQPDIAVLAGDINTSSSLFSLLSSLDIPALVIHGNMDSIAIGDPVAETGAIFLHNQAYHQDGLFFIGIGGSAPRTEMITVYESNELQRLDETACDILITHVPPKGVKDAAMLGRHIGSDWVRQFIEDRQPRVAICGHVHEDRGHAWLNNTMVVNCTVGKGGAYSVIEVESEISVQHI